MRHDRGLREVAWARAPVRDTDHPLVTVAVDDRRVFHAVEWAAAEAAARRGSLRVIHPSRPAVRPSRFETASRFLLAQREAIELVLHEAVARAHRVAPGLEVSTRRIDGSVEQALSHQAFCGGVLVLGGPDRPLGRFVFGRAASVAAAVRASCPLVVVRPDGLSHDDGAGPRTAARVVLALDRMSTCAKAITFAFRAAHQRGIPLTVLHVVPPDPPADMEGAEIVAEALQHRSERADGARRALMDLVVGWRAAFPEVTATPVILWGDPGRAVVEASQGSALVVLGSRGHRRRMTSTLGPVHRAVLRSARCPVAVIRP